MTIDLHQLPEGTVIAAGELVAYKIEDDAAAPKPWRLTGRTTPFGVGELLFMRQNWVVLRRGPETQKETT